MKVSFFEVGEREAQLVAGPVDIGLHRAEREIQDFGDLLVGAPLDMAQQNAGAVLGPERPDRRLDGATQLLGLDLVERRLLRGRRSGARWPRIASGVSA